MLEILLAVILGLILTVGGMILSAPLLSWMNTPEEVFGDSVTYLKVYFGGVLFNVIYNMAATTFVGQNYGAGKTERVKKALWVTVAMGFIYTIITGFLLLTFADPLMRMFTADDAVVAVGKAAMRYFCPFYFLLSILHGLAGVVRGTGKTVPPMVVLLVSLCLFRIVWIQFILPFFTTIDGIFMIYPVSWALGTVLMILYTWKGKWLNQH